MLKQFVEEVTSYIVESVDVVGKPINIRKFLEEHFRFMPNLQLKRILSRMSRERIPLQQFMGLSLTKDTKFKPYIYDEDSDNPILVLSIDKIVVWDKDEKSFIVKDGVSGHIIQCAKYSCSDCLSEQVSVSRVLSELIVYSNLINACTGVYEFHNLVHDDVHMLDKFVRLCLKECISDYDLSYTDIIEMVQQVEGEVFKRESSKSRIYEVVDSCGQCIARLTGGNKRAVIEVPTDIGIASFRIIVNYKINYDECDDSSDYNYYTKFEKNVGVMLKVLLCNLCEITITQNKVKQVFTTAQRLNRLNAENVITVKSVKDLE